MNSFRLAILALMPRRNRLIDGLLAFLWWMSLCIAAAVFIFAPYVVPALVPSFAKQLSSSECAYENAERAQAMVWGRKRQVAPLSAGWKEYLK